MLVNGWVVFHFLSEEDKRAIEGWFWVIGRGYLVLVRWKVDFDPWKSKLAKRHLWVILLRFRLHCWNIKGFMAVVNSIGKCIMKE